MIDALGTGRGDLIAEMIAPQLGWRSARWLSWVAGQCSTRWLRAAASAEIGRRERMEAES